MAIDWKLLRVTVALVETSVWNCHGSAATRPCSRRGDDGCVKGFTRSNRSLSSDWRDGTQHQLCIMMQTTCIFQHLAGGRLISSDFRSGLTVAHWRTHIDIEYPALHVASCSNPNTQRYSQTVPPCQLQHSCLFMYLCGFPADLSRCWVLWAAAIWGPFDTAWRVLARLHCVAFRVGVFIQAFIMMPLSRSLRCLCSCSHLRPFAGSRVLAASHHRSHLECCSGFIGEGRVFDLLSVFSLWDTILSCW